VRGAGSWEAAAKDARTRHWAHIASSMAGAIATKYIGSKNMGEFLWNERGPSAIDPDVF
jgi:hypothetical protein